MLFISSRSRLHVAMKNFEITLQIEELREGNVIENGTQLISYAGGFAHVYPFIEKGGNKIALRYWCSEITQIKERIAKIKSYFESINSSNYFVKFKYFDKIILVDGKFYPAILMDWIEAKNLKEYINDHINNPKILLGLASNFLKMVEYFHSIGVAHGDLQHENILVDDKGNLLVIDYDSMYVPGLEKMSDIIIGRDGFQHPSRRKNKLLNKKLDYFSELVIYLSIVIFSHYPELWEEKYLTENLLFNKEDFENPEHSELFREMIQSKKDPIISDLVVKLVGSLMCSDICELRKLEDLIESDDNLDRLAIDISNKF